MKHLFGVKIKELRETKGLSQVDLSSALKVTKQTISAWEKGLQETDFSMLIVIAKYFGVTTDYLLGLED